MNDLDDLALKNVAGVDTGASGFLEPRALLEQKSIEKQKNCTFWENFIDKSDSGTLGIPLSISGSAIVFSFKYLRKLENDERILWQHCRREKRLEQYNFSFFAFRRQII